MRIVRILLTVMLLAVAAGHAVAAQEMPPAKVVVAEIGRREVSENRAFIGLLYYDRQSKVSSEVAGLVAAVQVRAGDRVRAGEPLVQLDTEILEQDIALGQTRVEQIELRIRHAEKNYRRLERLLSSEGVSEKEYEDVRHIYEDLIKERQIVAEQLAKLLITKRKSLILAPFDGVILEKNVGNGDWVQQGKELVSLGSVNDLLVRVPVAETGLRFVRFGEAVVVVLNAYDRELAGIIEGVDPVADPQTKNVFLRVRIPPQPEAAANMSATVFVPTGAKRELAIIPRDALVKFQGKDLVYTVQDGKAAMLPVNIVTYLGKTVGADNPELTAGLSVVIEGNERLRPGQAVLVAGEN